LSNQPREGFTHRSVSFEDDQWEVGPEVARNVMGTSRTKVLNQLWAWWLRLPDATLPARPPADEVERAFEAWRERKAAQETTPRDDKPRS
jgi:hypothetical protein